MGRNLRVGGVVLCASLSLAGCGGIVVADLDGDAGGDGGVDATPDVSVVDVPVPVDVPPPPPDVPPPPIDVGPGPVVCPSAPPASGSACVGVGTCGYTSPCVLTADCIGGRWVTKGCPPPPPPPCPPKEPAAGAACPTEGQVCAWTSSCGGADDGVCKGGVWAIVRGPCPTPSPCPPAMPAAGSACSILPSEMCFWNNGCGAIANGTCKAGSWVISNPPCPPSCPPTFPGSGTGCPKPGFATCGYHLGPTCNVSCFCWEDYRWSCYGTPCG